MRKSTNYILVQEDRQTKIVNKQNDCLHNAWILKCSCCDKILISDNNINDTNFLKRLAKMHNLIGEEVEL